MASYSCSAAPVASSAAALGEVVAAASDEHAAVTSSHALPGSTSSDAGGSLRGDGDVLRDALRRHRGSLRLQDMHAAIDALASRGGDPASAAAAAAAVPAKSGGVRSGAIDPQPIANLEARRVQLSAAIRAAPSCARVGRLLLGRRHTLTSVHVEQALARMGQLVRESRRPPDEKEQEVFLGAREVLFSMLEQEGRQLSLGAACHLLCASTWMRLPLAPEQQAAVEAVAVPALPAASATHAQELLSSYLRLGMRPGRQLAAWVAPPVCAPSVSPCRSSNPACSTRASLAPGCQFHMCGGSASHPSVCVPACARAAHPERQPACAWPGRCFAEC